MHPSHYGGKAGSGDPAQGRKVRSNRGMWEPKMDGAVLLACVAALAYMVSIPGLADGAWTCEDCYTGRVLEVVDGNTLTVHTPEFSIIRIDLALVNTPELREAGGSEARDFSSSICLPAKPVWYQPDLEQSDIPKRFIAEVWCQEQSLNAALIKSRHAKLDLDKCDQTSFHNKDWTEECRGDASNEEYDTDVLSGNLPISPQEQFESGVPLYEIICDGDNVLLESPSGAPACVNPDSVKGFVNRGYGIVGTDPAEEAISLYIIVPVFISVCGILFAIMIYKKYIKQKLAASKMEERYKKYGVYEEQFVKIPDKSSIRHLNPALHQNKTKHGMAASVMESDDKSDQKKSPVYSNNILEKLKIMHTAREKSEEQVNRVIKTSKTNEGIPVDDVTGRVIPGDFIASVWIEAAKCTSETWCEAANVSECVSAPTGKNMDYLSEYAVDASKAWKKASEKALKAAEVLPTDEPKTWSNAVKAAERALAKAAAATENAEKATRTRWTTKPAEAGMSDLMDALEKKASEVKKLKEAEIKVKLTKEKTVKAMEDIKIQMSKVYEVANSEMLKAKATEATVMDKAISLEAKLEKFMNGKDTSFDISSNNARQEFAIYTMNERFRQYGVYEELYVVSPNATKQVSTAEIKETRAKTEKVLNMMRTGVIRATETANLEMEKAKAAEVEMRSAVDDVENLMSEIDATIQILARPMETADAMVEQVQVSETTESTRTKMVEAMKTAIAETATAKRKMAKLKTVHEMAERYRLCITSSNRENQKFVAYIMNERQQIYPAFKTLFVRSDIKTMKDMETIMMIPSDATELLLATNVKMLNILGSLELHASKAIDTMESLKAKATSATEAMETAAPDVTAVIEYAGAAETAQATDDLYNQLVRSANEKKQKYAAFVMNERRRKYGVYEKQLLKSSHRAAVLDYTQPNSSKSVQSEPALKREIKADNSLDSFVDDTTPNQIISQEDDNCESGLALYMEYIDGLYDNIDERSKKSLEEIDYQIGIINTLSNVQDDNKFVNICRNIIKYLHKSVNENVQDNKSRMKSKISLLEKDLERIELIIEIPNQEHKNSNNDDPKVIFIGRAREITAEICKIINKNASSNKNQLEYQKLSLQTILEQNNDSILANLTKSTSNTTWDEVSVETVDKWEYLTDKREGSERQREFVEKALSTPDFAILEGPPGSGKTTVMCELIVQLMKSDRDVLVCGSTHVAVDNILEKLVEQVDDSESKILRIGRKSKKSIRDDPDGSTPSTLEDTVDEDLSKISEIAQKYIHNIYSKNSDEQTVIWSPRVAFGTPMGLYRYLKARDRPFDVMIIDEASKTTFQEFVVPAIHANRWIIVGDTRQLSPYANTNDVGSVIKSKINNDYFDVCRDVFLATKSIVLVIIDDTDSTLIDIYRQQCKKINVKFYDMIRSPEDIIGSGIVITNIDSLPNTKFPTISPMPKILISPDIKKSIKKSMKKYTDDTTGDLDKWSKIEATEVNDWEHEVGYRLRLDYETTISNKNPETILKSGYMKNISRLLLAGQEDTFLEAMREILTVAFPSILELLQTGNIYYRAYSKPSDGSVLEIGMPEEVLRKRHVLLTHQYRMHPDIAKFARDHFYDGSALKSMTGFDGKRKFNHDVLKERLCWVDVDHKQNSEKNFREIKQILLQIEHLHKLPRKEEGGRWEIGILSFYRQQNEAIEKELEKKNLEQDRLTITNGTVDSFQGKEFDIVFIGFTKSHPTPFLNSLNRLNVAITRAKYLCVLVGKYDLTQEADVDSPLRALEKIKKYPPFKRDRDSIEAEIENSNDLDILCDCAFDLIKIKEYERALDVCKMIREIDVDKTKESKIMKAEERALSRMKKFKHNSRSRKNIIQ